jgi:glycosyltransferase involved in cell wall biosynthesis
LTPTPTVTVVIPTLGRWARLESALRAARAQEGVQVHVVLVFDGEVDEEQLGRLVADDVTVLRLPERRGPAAARNAGLEAAEGEWVALLDDDDLWAPGKLVRQVSAAEAAGAAFAYVSAVLVDATLRPLAVQTAPPVAGLPVEMLEHNPIPACASNLLVRRELAQQLRFDEDLSHFSDWDFAARLIAAAPGAACQEVLVAYVHHDQAMHLARVDGAERELVRFRAKHRAAGRDMAELPATRWIGHGYRKARRPGRAASVHLGAAVRHRSAADLARAAGSLLGERAVRLATRHRRPSAAVVVGPDWLALYR